MPALILISGAGQLGSRYLQGMAKCSSPLRIFVHDCNKRSIELAKKRWDEVSSQNNAHVVSYITSLKKLPRTIDIAIVSTTADVRLSAVNDICKNTNVNYWILEKVLVQSENDLDKLISTINSSNAWVNTTRRLMPWYQNIRKQLDCSSPTRFEVKGGSWGLACNAIHFLDLFSWWSGESLQNLYTEDLNKNWFESKRINYWEVLGELKAEFSGGSVANIYADETNEPELIRVINNHSWYISEKDGLAKRSDGIIISGNIIFQSDLTAPLIESILDYGSCNLPLLKESAELHRVFIRHMYEHWKRAGNPLATYVPIT